MLGERIARHKVKVWLVNTGWTGGPYGIGTRMKLSHTRAMVRAVLAGALDGVTYHKGSGLWLRGPGLGPRRTVRHPLAAPDLG